MNAKEGFLMFFIFRFLNLCAGLVESSPDVLYLIKDMNLTLLV